jgi:GT2 family glycosyltransferase
MSGDPDISVIVVNYNGREHLDTCLRALEVQQNVDFECVVVDNGSRDQSASFVRERFPWVRLVESGKNLGCAGGNNRGAAVARGRLLAFLNNDTRAEPTWLSALARGLDEAADVALAASRIVYMHDSAILDSAGDGMTRAGGAFKHGHGAPAGRYGSRREVFGACGAAFLVPRAVFDEAGGFDEDFFVSHEDVDLSYRIRLLGYRCMYVPEAIVQHAGSATLGRTSRLSVYYGQRNLEWVYWKNTPLKLLVLSLPRHLAYMLAASAYFTSIGRLPTFAAAKWAALRGLPRLRGKRRAIQRARRVPDSCLWAMLDPGWLGLKLREKRFDLRNRVRIL